MQGVRDEHQGAGEGCGARAGGKRQEKRCSVSGVSSELKTVFTANAKNAKEEKA
jgi:hypothetical protein